MKIQERIKKIRTVSVLGRIQNNEDQEGEDRELQ